MKKIKDEVSMAGSIENISISELRKSPGEVLKSVELGKTYVICRSGKPVAVLSKPPGETLCTEIGSSGEITGYSM